MQGPQREKHNYQTPVQFTISTIGILYFAHTSIISFLKTNVSQRPSFN